MERETCKECEKEFIEQIGGQNIDDFLEETSIMTIKRNICIKCLVKIVNRYI